MLLEIRPYVYLNTDQIKKVELKSYIELESILLPKRFDAIKKALYEIDLDNTLNFNGVNSFEIVKRLSEISAKDPSLDVTQISESVINYVRDKEIYNFQSNLSEEEQAYKAFFYLSETWIEETDKYMKLHEINSTYLDKFS